MNFKLSNPTRLYFGNLAMNNLGHELKDAKRILLVYGGGSIKKSGLYDNLMAILSNLNKIVFEIQGVSSNPTLDKINEGANLCKEFHIDYILAVGGGSVLDCAKGIAVAALYEGDIWDVIKNKKPVTKKIPLGTILTNSATSSENNYYSVITNTDTIEKIGWAVWPLNFPEFSIVDSKYMISVPKDHTIYGIVDIMSHMIENYFHNKDVDNPIIAITDRHIETMLKYMISLGKQLVLNLENIELRESISYIGTQSLSTHSRHIIEGDWACHSIEHAITAIYDIPHGGGLAIIIPHWMLHIYKKATPKFKMFANNVMELSQKEEESDQEFALRGINRFSDFLIEIGAPTKLSYYHINDDKIIDMVKKSLNSQITIGNNIPLGQHDIESILRASL